MKKGRIFHKKRGFKEGAKTAKKAKNLKHEKKPEKYPIEIGGLI